MDYVEVFTRKDGKHGWRRRNGRNTQIVSTDGNQGYEDEDYCVEMAGKLNPGCPIHRVADIEDDPYNLNLPEGLQLSAEETALPDE